MTENVIFNNKLISLQEINISVRNRAFRYGDGVFETIRCIDGKPLWMTHHIERLQKSAETLKMQLPQWFSETSVVNAIVWLLESNGLSQGGARVRLSMFREEGGLYRPLGKEAEILIESSPLENKTYRLNKNGLSAGVYTDIVKGCNSISGLKTSSALLPVMAYLHAGDKGWDEVIVLNDNGFVAEAGSSNIFMVDKGLLVTPSVDQGCVEGVMRKVLLDVAVRHNIKVLECAILPEDLLKADEVFITNAISGIQWVKGIENKRYYHDFANRLTQLLNNEVQDFIEKIFKNNL